MHVGWDWASQRHDVTVIDDTGQLVDRWTLTHNEAGIHQAMTRLAGHGRPEHLPVAIEATSGIVVDRLLAAGHPVVPIHPNSFNAARPRWGASKAKSDPGDSFKLADYLRTDGHRLRRLQPTDAATRHLQAISRLRADHLEAKTTATNQLSALLEAHWPGAKAIFARLDSDIALDFLERYPTPQAAQRLGEARLAAFLAATATAAGAPQSSCFTGCGPPRSQSTSSIPRSWPTASASRSGCCAACLAASPTWIGPWPPPWASIPRPRSSSRCLASARSTWPRSWPRSARSWTGSATSPTPLPRLAPPRSPSSPATAPWSSSAGQPIPVPATPWASSPTTAATPLRGQPTCTGKPAGAASATPRPSAS
jgi:hypothetical protein